MEITPFYASVHSYVSLAEQTPLPQLRELLNAYFEGCVAEIEREGGTLDKFVGDAIVAMFGAPTKTPDHALHGCVAALRCQARVDGLRERLRKEGDRWPLAAKGIRVRVGLHTGIAVVGQMKTQARFNYTMMGDNVNLAARLESAAKNYGVWTLCTETTKRACEQIAPERVLFRSLGRIIVKGRADPIELFEPAALREDVTGELSECIARYELGLSRWRERAWDDAIQHFEISAKLERDQPGTSREVTTNPSLVFLKMARSFRDNPGTGPLVV